MDPLSIAASVLTAVDAIWRVLPDKLKTQYVLLRHNYGFLLALLTVVFFRDIASDYERIDNVVLRGSRENASAFRQAVTDECNMTAVAGAIIAQVAISALSFADLSSTHWIARAFFLFAVTSGRLSVYYSCVLQRAVGKLHDPDLIRDWLSLPPNEKDETPSPSLAAVFIVSAPFAMMKAAIFALLLGLAVYQGFIWTKALDKDAGSNDSRDVFITFLVGAGSCVSFYFLTFSSKSIEGLIRIDRRRDYFPPAPRRYGSSQQQQVILEMTPGLPTAPGQIVSDTTVDLPALLEAAAQAHLHCADTNKRVANEYLRLSRGFA